VIAFAVGSAIRFFKTFKRVRDISGFLARLDACRSPEEQPDK
jgi:hypothetical protein